MKSIIIGIAGGSGSGKSTFANRLIEHFGDQIAVLRLDNYYRAQDNVSFKEREKVNYDHPDALEIELLLEHLIDLKEGKSIQCPVYDYSMHNRSKKTLVVEPRSIILIEGILLFTDERLRNLFDIKIYVDADADERILRRLERDVRERGRSITSVMEQYLSSVKPMHYLYVEPTRSLADIVLNSGKNEVAFDLVVSMVSDTVTKNKEM